MWTLEAYRRTHSPSRLAWSESRQPLDAVLHSSNEPGELSQWLCHDNSTINICIIIIIVLLLLLYDWYKQKYCSRVLAVLTQYTNVTDRQRTTAEAALMHSIARQKPRHTGPEIQLGRNSARQCAQPRTARSRLQIKETEIFHVSCPRGKHFSPTRRLTATTVACLLIRYSRQNNGPGIFLGFGKWGV